MSSKNSHFYTIEETCSGEIIEKKSRFIGSIYHVESQEEVDAILENVRKTYWDARHNCYAYILGIDASISRCSDDGEPSKTAGMPILEVLKGNELTNVLAVVTRYFGGVLLGTGGLVRAYTDATAEAIANGSIVKRTLSRIYDFSTDYSSVGKIKYVLSEQGATILKEDYTDLVTFRIAVSLEQCPQLEKALINSTNGKINLEGTSNTVVYL